MSAGHRVRAAILTLLTERPMHGYELIREIHERTHGGSGPARAAVDTVMSAYQVRRSRSRYINRFLRGP